MEAHVRAVICLASHTTSTCASGLNTLSTTCHAEFRNEERANSG